MSEGAERRFHPLAFALLTLSYTAAAWLGLRWTTMEGVAPPVWPAAGIALAGVVLCGWRVAPAILIGLPLAALLSVPAHPWWWSQLGIAAGNAFAAVAGAALIRRIGRPNFIHLSSVNDVLVLLAAAIVASAISTAGGVICLVAAEIVPFRGVEWIALTWFFGDAVGILTVATIILSTVANRRAKEPLPGRVPAPAFALALLAVTGLCYMVFFGPPVARAWAIYPALVWVALVGRVWGVALTMLLVCVVAGVGTLMGHGPFIMSDGSPDFALMQQFLAVTGVTSLLLAAAVDERRTETRLRQMAADELAARLELQRTTSLLRLVGDAMPSFVYAKDVEGRFIYANQALLDLYDRPAGEVLGRTDFDFSSISEAEAFRTNDRQVMESGVPSELEEDLTVDGEVRTYFSVKAPLRGNEGSITGIVGISTDITERRQQQKELERLARRAEIAQRAARSSLYEYDVVTGEVARDPVVADICGIRRHDLGPAQSDWERHIHPEDLAAFKKTVASAFEGFERYALEYRVIGSDHRVTWISDTGTIIRDADGQVRQIIGLVTDVTVQKAADERERLLAREVDHRAKNLLAVVQSVVQLTRAEDGDQLKAGITGRIQSLARAHSLLADSRWEGVELTQLAREEVAPFAEEQDGRIGVRGPRLLLKPAAAQSLALVLHELATNAAKYGALSAPNGRLDLSWCVEGDGGLLMVWQERDGPAGGGVEPTRSGFGSRLIKASIERQLRGTVAYDWAAAGLTVTMTIAPEYVTLADRGAGSDMAASA